MSQSVLNDRQVIRDYGFAIVLIYAGCDLVSITLNGRKPEFTILCPKFDLESYKQEYDDGVLQISDAKAFNWTHSNISRLCGDAKRSVSGYVNPDFIPLLRYEAAARSTVGGE